MAPIKVSRRGKPKFVLPKFTCRSIMFTIQADGDQVALKKLGESLHGCWDFGYLQGETSNEGHAHIQGYVHSKKSRGLSPKKIAEVLFKTGLFKDNQQLSCEQVKAREVDIVDAKSPLHYVSKPHKDCSCKHCSKVEKPNWWDGITWGTVPLGQGQRKDIEEAIELVKAAPLGKRKQVMIEECSSTYVKYHGGFDKVIKYYDDKDKVALWKNPLQDVDLKMWQILLYVKAVWLPWDTRKGMWIWSTESNTYKSTTMEWIQWLERDPSHWSSVLEMGKDFNYKNWVMMASKIPRVSINWYNIPRETDFDDVEHGKNYIINQLERATDHGLKRAGKYDGQGFINTAVTVVTANIACPHHLIPQRFEELRLGDPRRFEKKPKLLPAGYIFPMEEEWRIK